MTEFRAQILIVVVAQIVVGVAVLGLAALGANSSAIALGVIIPTIVSAYLSARVVMHYGDEADDRRR